MFTLNSNSNYRGACGERPLPTIGADESLSNFLSRLIAEMLSCEETDRVRAAHIRQLIDVTADELEIHYDLAALAARPVQCEAGMS